MDQLFIPADGARPISEVPTAQMTAYWSKTSVWHRLKEHLASEAQKKN
jgi:hypothetical protein